MKYVDSCAKENEENGKLCTHAHPANKKERSGYRIVSYRRTGSLSIRSVGLFVCSLSENYWCSLPSPFFPFNLSTFQGLLPRESFLVELDRAVVLAVADSQSHLVAEGTRSANHDTHSANLVLHLSADKVLDVGTAWEHLHGG